MGQVMLAANHSTKKREKRKKETEKRKKRSDAYEAKKEKRRKKLYTLYTLYKYMCLTAAYSPVHMRNLHRHSLATCPCLGLAG